MKSNLDQCLVCYSTRISPLVSIAKAPVHCNILWQTRDDALNAPKGEIELAYCQNCGHIFNQRFNPERIKYSEAYDNSLHFSPTFQNYAESLANWLIERFDLHEKNIIEIGCGQGEFLRLLCEIGGNRGIGFDPSYIHESELDPGFENIEIIQDFYTDKYQGYQANFFCSRHVLEHLNQPREFLEVLAQAARQQKKAWVYLEVPNALFTFRKLSIWDIIYEHPSYFSQDSLTFLLNACGFYIIDVDTSFGDQFLYAVAEIKNNEMENATTRRIKPGEMDDLMVSFQEKFKTKSRDWREVLNNILKNKHRAVLWGAGSKGVTFLNLFAELNAIDFVVDISPRKWGRFIPGTGQRIVAPDFLSDYRPDKVIIMNPIYKKEIKSLIEELNIDADILVA